MLTPITANPSATSHDDPMSLYFEAAKIIDEKSAVSLKTRVYGNKALKNPGGVFALVSEATKWSQVLAEVIEKSGILGIERKVCRFLLFQTLQSVSSSVEMEGDYYYLILTTIASSPQPLHCF